MKRFLLFAGLAVLLLPSCKDDSSAWLDRTPIFRVLGPDGTEAAEISLNGRAQAVDFIVLSSEAWTTSIEGCEEYSIEPQLGGSGRTVVSLSTSVNETGADRNVILRFTADGDIVKEFAITQAVQEPYIDITSSVASISGYGGEFTVSIETNQAAWTYSLEPAGSDSWIQETARTENSVTFSALANDSGAARNISLTFSSVDNPEVFSTLNLSQPIPASVPTDLILDVVFAADGTASDRSSMNMTVDNSRRNADCGVTFVDRFGLYAATFNNGELARSSLDNGYYRIPYEISSEFANKIADGCTIELVFCTYYAPGSYDGGSKQVKPFASTQAGGIGICLRANSSDIQLETHSGGSWHSPRSEVVPVAREYYHVIGIYDKSSATSSIYVNGVFGSSQSAPGDFAFMTTSVDSRWFGIGADPNHQDKGEASFYGEVVIARIYDAPMTEAQVAACYHEVME